MVKPLSALASQQEGLVPSELLLLGEEKNRQFVLKSMLKHVESHKTCVQLTIVETSLYRWAPITIVILNYLDEIKRFDLS